MYCESQAWRLCLGENLKPCPDSSCPAGGAGPGRSRMRSALGVRRRAGSPAPQSQLRPGNRSRAALARALRHEPVTERGAAREAAVAEVSAARKGRRAPRGGLGPPRAAAASGPGCRGRAGGGGPRAARGGARLGRCSAFGALSFPHRLSLPPAAPPVVPTCPRCPLNSRVLSFPAGPGLHRDHCRHLLPATCRDLCPPAGTPCAPGSGGLWHPRHAGCRGGIWCAVPRPALNEEGTVAAVPWLWASAGSSGALGVFLPAVGTTAMLTVLSLLIAWVSFPSVPVRCSKD